MKSKLLKSLLIITMFVSPVFADAGDASLSKADVPTVEQIVKEHDQAKLKKENFKPSDIPKETKKILNDTEVVPLEGLLSKMSKALFVALGAILFLALAGYFYKKSKSAKGVKQEKNTADDSNQQAFVPADISQAVVSFVRHKID